MERAGYRRPMLKVGTAATVVGYPHRSVEDRAAPRRITIGGRAIELREPTTRRRGTSSRGRARAALGGAVGLDASVRIADDRGRVPTFSIVAGSPRRSMRVGGARTTSHVLPDTARRTWPWGCS